MMMVHGSCWGTPYGGVSDVMSMSIVILCLAMTIHVVIRICNSRNSKCKSIEIEGSEKFTYDNKSETEEKELALTHTFKNKK